MEKEKILTAIREFIASKKPFTVKTLLKNKCPRTYRWVLERTAFLDKYDIIKDGKHSISIFERLYCIEHDLQERPLCRTCHINRVCNFDKQKMEYKKWCSPRCQAKDPSCVAASKVARKAKYGNENYNGADKARQTRMKNNNGKWHADDFDAKCKATNVANGHDPSWHNCDKAGQTLKRRLEENPDFWKIRNEKSQQTKIANGHTLNWNNREKFKTTVNGFSEHKKREIVKRRKMTNSHKYGCDFPMQNLEVRDQMQQTLRERYGVNSTFQIPSVRERAKLRVKEKTWTRLCQDACNYVPLFSEDEFMKNDDPEHVWHWKCMRCGNEFESRWADGHHTVCRNCYPRKSADSISNEEKEISTLVRDLCRDQLVLTSDRNLIKPLELDIFLPQKKLAIEFDGLYWHSEDIKPKGYHLDKTEKCEAKGIQLIHIFEDEWLHKRPIVESRLKNLLGVHEHIVFARKCEVREVTTSESLEFQEANHIQGAVGAKVHLGLYFEGSLISLMTFGKPRFNKRIEWELLRFCNKLGYHVPGGAGKLLRHFERNWKPMSLISYADRRWSRGKLYKALGFKLDHASKPDYWYINMLVGELTLQSRHKFQKHKLPTVLESFDPSQTEVENMRNNGYTRIFDCGNLVFVKTYSMG